MMRSNASRAPLLLASLIPALFISCAETPPSRGPYRYQPAEHELKGNRSETVYQIPKDDPRWNVSVRFLGVENHSIHMLLAATSQAASGELDIDSGDLTISFPNGAQSKPGTANPPEILVEPGGHFGMDLYFALPQGLDSDRIPTFEFHWKAQTWGWNYARDYARNYAWVTHFKRVQAPKDTYEMDPDWSPLYDVGTGIVAGPEWGVW